MGVGAKRRVIVSDKIVVKKYFLPVAKVLTKHALTRVKSFAFAGQLVLVAKNAHKNVPRRLSRSL